jgi:hypothetical protein
MKTISLALLALCCCSAFAQDKPRVYVTDKPMDRASLIAMRNGNHGAAVANVQRGDDPRTVEIQAVLIKACPKVTVTNNPETADFTLMFRRQENKRSSMFAFGGLAGLALSAGSKVDGASLFAANGDLVAATQQRSVEKSITEVCKAIPMTVQHVEQTTTTTTTTKTTTEPPVATPADQAAQAQQYADCLKVAVNNPSITCKQ